jgi:branched-subunit amino acid aminotransferase/4-amino-4-deoxychorismate lyase
MAKYLMLNGDIMPADKPCLMHNNRSILYADSFSFTLRGNSSKAFFLEEYFDFLLRAVKSLNFERTLSLRKAGFAIDLELVLQKNRIYKGFKADITIFRNSDGSDKCSVLIVPEALPDEYYVQPQKGLSVLVYKKFVLPEYIFESEITPIYSKEFFIAREIEHAEIDDFLLCDVNEKIIRSTKALVFFVKEGNLILPTRLPVNSSSVFAAVVEKAAILCGVPVVRWDVSEKDLYDLDEIFIGDVVNGLVSVRGYKEKRFYNKVAARIQKQINDEAAEKVR